MSASCIFFAAALAFLPSDARNAHALVEDFVEKCPVRDAGSRGARFASGYIYSHLSALGVTATIDRFEAATPEGVKPFANVTAEWRAGQNADAAPWVVFTSHYDTKRGCPGANDGASTSALLLALAGVFQRSAPLECNVALMWLDGEECMKAYLTGDGFWGSKRAAAKLKDSGRKVRAVVCLDMLGDADLNISVPRNCSPSLAKAARIAIARLKKRGVKNKIEFIDELVKDDHVAFLDCAFPAIDFIDFDYGGEKGENLYWHTVMDTPDKVSVESLLYSGRLALEFLNAVIETGKR